MSLRSENRQRAWRVFLRIYSDHHLSQAEKETLTHLLEGRKKPLSASLMSRFLSGFTAENIYINDWWDSSQIFALLRIEESGTNG